MSTIGSTAPSQNTINYDSLLSMTLMAYRPKLIDNIYKSNSFLSALRANGGIDYQDGGERVQQPLLYGENDTFKSFKGYEQMSVKPQDGITSAFYDWAEIGGTISISRREERQNSGEAALMRLLEKKIMQAEMSAKAIVNRQLLAGTISGTEFVPGNDTKDLLPLGYFLPKDVTANPGVGGNVGNISRVTNSWWRPNSAVLDSGSKDTGNKFALSVSTYKGMAVALRRMYNYCTRGADGSGPNIVLMDQNSYETYVNALDNKIQYTDTRMADLGFDAVRLLGASVIWDELVPDIDQGQAHDYATFTGTAFFLNTKFYQLVIDKNTDFITTPFVEPENSNAKTAKLLFMGQATVSNARKLGVCYAISQSITS